MLAADPGLAITIYTAEPNSKNPEQRESELRRSAKNTRGQGFRYRTIPLQITGFATPATS
jgi:hypothetical protein